MGTWRRSRAGKRILAQASNPFRPHASANRSIRRLCAIQQPLPTSDKASSSADEVERESPTAPTREDWLLDEGEVQGSIAIERVQSEASARGLDIQDPRRSRCMTRACSEMFPQTVSRPDLEGPKSFNTQESFFVDVFARARGRHSHVFKPAGSGTLWLVMWVSCFPLELWKAQHHSARPQTSTQQRPGLLSG